MQISSKLSVLFKKNGCMIVSVRGTRIRGMFLFYRVDSSHRAYEDNEISVEFIEILYSLVQLQKTYVRLMSKLN